LHYGTRTNRHDRAVSTLSRRQAIAGGVALLTTGGTLFLVSEPTSAQVSVEKLSIADKTFTSESARPVLDVTAAYDYDAGMSPVQSIRLALSVSGGEIDSLTLATSRTTLSGEETLAAPITDSSSWAVADFDPAVGESVSHEVSATLSFAVRDGDGNDIVSDSATDTAVVTVEHPQENTYTASVGGVGEFRTPSE